MANTSILAAFERMWQHITTALETKAEVINKIVGTGNITMTIEDNTEYTYTDVTSLTMTGNEYQACGIIIFGSSIPTISVSGFTASSGDDITTAVASEKWEFNCYKGNIIWKNWSA